MFSMYKILEKSHEQSYLDSEDSEDRENDKYFESSNKKHKRRGERTVNTPQIDRNFNLKIEELQQNLNKNLSKMKKSFYNLESVEIEKNVSANDSLNYSGAEKLTQVFKTAPEVNQDSTDVSNEQSNQAVDTWKSLKPITLYEISKNSQSEVDFNN